MGPAPRSSTPRASRWVVLGLLTCSSALTACGKEDDSDQKKAADAARAMRGQPAGGGGDAAGSAPSISPAAMLERARPLFGALPAAAESPDNPITDEKVALGRMLYFDARLSKNHDVSCNTCHDLASFGVDPRRENHTLLPTSKGHRGQLGERNSPTVYNAAFHIAQFWDGRARDVEEQAKGPILNPVEMAMPDETSVEKVLASIPGYVELFAAAFPDDAKPLSYDNMAKAIGAFERKLVTPAPFDRFMQGDTSALDDKQLYGLQLFIDAGCVTCHTGPNLGGNAFQKLGNVKPWPKVSDLGRFIVTQVEADKYTFKVPGLRNVSKTAPYLHDGSVATLDEMVRLMVAHQTPRGELRPNEVEAIVAFLDSLTGEVPTEYIAEPTLPQSGPDTPGPDPA
jgi:cytochrome c peroxidase